MIVPSTSRRAGFTLVELLVAMVVFAVVFGGAISFAVAQSRGLQHLAARGASVQSGRFGRDLLRTEIRTAGSNVTDVQPIIVVANDSVLAFNADLTTNLRDAVSLTGALYVDPYAPASEVTALTVDRRITVPGTNPGVAYPQQNYSQIRGMFINSDAELLTFWFAPDSLAGPNRYALWRRVNDRAPELVATGIQRALNQPFFRYWYDPTDLGVVDASLDTVPRSWLPLAKTVAQRGISPDTGIAVTTRIDALRAVEVNYEVTPPRGGTREVVRYVVPMPNIANTRQTRACGRSPLPPEATTVAWNSDSGYVQITISPSVDDGGGERDAVRYVLWRQRVGDASWGEPIATVAATQLPSYTMLDAGMPVRPQAYRYAVAVQDCTPNLSPTAVSAPVTLP